MPKMIKSWTSRTQLKKLNPGKYMPHQGHSEREKRMMQGITQQWKKALRFSVGGAAPESSEVPEFLWGRGACLPEDRHA